MSLVYKAKDLENSEIVAVKTLKTYAQADETVVKRFQREAEVLHLMNHPRIVEVMNYGSTARGQPFFVMDYLIGKSLSEIIRTEGALELERFQDIFVQVAAAIGHAHKHGAIHRDIKPGNIMLVERGGTSDYVKIVDFGIAKLKEEAQRLTRLGEVWGSPIYMSPEQCMGTTIDARSDIYSLGVVMYEALTGEVPFLGKTYVETMTRQISEPPPAFIETAPDRDIPETLEKIVFTALRKDPEHRYQSMLEMKRDLEMALFESATTAPEVEPPSSIFGVLARESEENGKSGGRGRSRPVRRSPSRERIPKAQVSVTREDEELERFQEEISPGEGSSPIEESDFTKDSGRHKTGRDSSRQPGQPKPRRTLTERSTAYSDPPSGRSTITRVFESQNGNRGEVLKLVLKVSLAAIVLFSVAYIVSTNKTANTFWREYVLGVKTAGEEPEQPYDMMNPTTAPNTNTDGSTFPAEDEQYPSNSSNSF